MKASIYWGVSELFQKRPNNDEEIKEDNAFEHYSQTIFVFYNFLSGHPDFGGLDLNKDKKAWQKVIGLDEKTTRLRVFVRDMNKGLILRCWNSAD